MKVIITGTTGYVGEGVMLSCLDDERIEKILSVSRKPIGICYPKLEEYIVEDFLKLPENDPKLQGYDGVFFCAGCSSVGMPMDEYKITCQDIPLHFAKAVGPNPNSIFTFVSGAGTSDKNPQKWAKIKSVTEKELIKMNWRGAYNFRVMIMRPHPKQHFRPKFISSSKRLYPLMRLLGMANTIEQVADAMITLYNTNYHTPFIGVRDVNKLSKKTK